MREEIMFLINKIKPDKYISLHSIKRLLCCSDYRAQKIIDYMIENDIATPIKYSSTLLIKR